MSSLNRSQSSARRSDYVWQYEYYDEEPVSFEGLMVHRYSIVIGFWVGLAVFVIFMFFVLTLLTKTEAPHQENPDSENLPGPGNCLVNITGPKVDEDDSDDDKVVSRPFLAESRSYFHFYISEDGEDMQRQKPEAKQNGPLGTYMQSGGTTPAVMVEQEDEDLRILYQELPINGPMVDERQTDAHCAFLTHLTIPNFVNFEQNSLGEDDLLCEPHITLDQNINNPRGDIP
nr:melanocortin-2 receptor accessory protein 2-like [Nerophis lumbriciformis]